MALLKIHAVGVCGSDIHAYAGHQPFFTYPRVLGHEIAAHIVEIRDDGASGFKCDDRVTVVPYIPCGKCDACTHGKPNTCLSMQTLGVHIDGGLSEYLVVPVHTLEKIDDPSLSDSGIATVEPFAIGAHVAMRADPAKDDKVLVCGTGPIGVASAKMIETYGANVCFAEVNPGRTAYATEHFGYHVLDPTADDFNDKLLAFFSGHLPDIVVDATGNKQSMSTSYRYIRAGGRVVFVGLFRGSFSIEDVPFHEKESELRISRTATHEDFRYVLSCIAEKKIDPDEFISHTFGFASAEEAMRKIVAPGNDIFKAIISFS
jgi:2-desacetyl-2-hydroxyethyl bacteriochlorophyllide A dehydrogenase